MKIIFVKLLHRKKKSNAAFRLMTCTFLDFFTIGALAQMLELLKLSIKLY